MPNNKMERFTQRARRVLSLAQEEAERLRHNYIGTEHMLLGLLREEGGVASRVLRDLGLEQQRVEELVTELTRATARTTATTPELSPGTKRVLELAVDEARRMGHHYIGTEHLLLGLVRQSEGVAIDVLKRLGVSPEQVRRQTRKALLKQPTVQPQPSPSPSAPVPESTLTEGAGRVLLRTRQYVDQFQLIMIDPEHLLVGLMREENSVAGQVLRNCGLELQRVEELVAELTHAAPRTTETHPELSQRTKNVLELAVDEARRLRDDLIDTQHILTGLVRQPESVAIAVLTRLGVSRQEVLRVLQEKTVQNPPPVIRRPSPKQPVHYVGTNSIYLVESLMKKMLDMVGEGKLTVEQANEMLGTLQEGLKLNTGMQAWLTTLVKQKEQSDPRYVQITVSNRDSQEELYTLTLSLAEALAKLDQLLLATVPDNKLESVDFESDTSPIRVELRIVNNKDKPDE